MYERSADIQKYKIKTHEELIDLLLARTRESSGWQKLEIFPPYLQPLLPVIISKLPSHNLYALLEIEKISFLMTESRDGGAYNGSRLQVFFSKKSLLEVLNKKQNVIQSLPEFSTLQSALSVKKRVKANTSIFSKVKSFFFRSSKLEDVEVTTSDFSEVLSAAIELAGSDEEIANLLHALFTVLVSTHEVDLVSGLGLSLQAVDHELRHSFFTKMGDEFRKPKLLTNVEFSVSFAIESVKYPLVDREEHLFTRPFATLVQRLEQVLKKEILDETNIQQVLDEMVYASWEEYMNFVLDKHFESAQGFSFKDFIKTYSRQFYFTGLTREVSERVSAVDTSDKKSLGEVALYLKSIYNQTLPDKVLSELKKFIEDYDHQKDFPLVYAALSQRFNAHAQPEF